MDTKQKKTIFYRYNFKFNNGKEQDFKVELDNKTLSLIQDVPKSYPKWTELNVNKCPNCSLDETKNKFCPAAVSIIPLVNVFAGLLSYEEVDVTVETEDRKYTKHTTLQKGLSSLLGIYMVTCGCPILDKLKPMVRYHLPFATVEETKYRVLSMYLLSQYFIFRRKGTPDWELKNLVKIYNEIKIVNKSFCKRLSYIETEDASTNALIILNCFADSVTISINRNVLKEIELLFEAYF